MPVLGLPPAAHYHQALASQLAWCNTVWPRTAYPQCRRCGCCCSNKLEAMGAKQDAVASKVDGISKQLAGQGTKLETLEATCGEMAQVGVNDKLARTQIEGVAACALYGCQHRDGALAVA
jgi:hypothetical protein